MTIIPRMNNKRVKYLASALHALVGVFGFQSDGGRREALLVAVDVAVVQAGADGRRRRRVGLGGACHCRRRLAASVFCHSQIIQFQTAGRNK